MLKAPNKSYGKETYLSHRVVYVSVHVCTPVHAYVSVCSNKVS